MNYKTGYMMASCVPLVFVLWCHYGPKSSPKPT